MRRHRLRHVQRRRPPPRRRPRHALRLPCSSSPVLLSPLPRRLAPSRVRRRPRQAARRVHAPSPAPMGCIISRSVRQWPARQRSGRRRHRRAPFLTAPGARRATAAIAPLRLGKCPGRLRPASRRRRQLAHAPQRLRRSPRFPARSCRVRRRPALRCQANPALRFHRLPGRFRRLAAKPRSPAPMRRTSPVPRPFRACLMRRPVNRRSGVPAESDPLAPPRSALPPAPSAASCSHGRAQSRARSTPCSASAASTATVTP